jgi:exopolyphosphatase/guanosine-5'-triphosphate,3'-diphosphate pyrophosphatase
MRIAAIDVGTNSTRLLVAEVRPGGFRTLEKRTIVTRLGQNVDKTRTLRQDALERTLAVVADYAAVCGEYGVERMIVSGTSAVRDATNRDEFFNGVKSLTGVEPVVLTGEEEARTTFAGAVSDLEPTRPMLLIDIGGGSTELIYGRAEPEALISIDIGVVRMLEKHLHSDPPAESELEVLREEVVDSLSQFKVDVEVDPGTRMIGVAGTVTQLAAIKAGLAVYDPDVVHHSVLSHGDVRMLARRLESLPYDKRRRVKGLEPGRADVIVAGAEILLCAMESFDAPEVLVSESDILDGLVLQLLDAAEAQG